MVNNRTLLETELCDLHLKTPITTASGTFGSVSYTHLTLPTNREV